MLCCLSGYVVALLSFVTHHYTFRSRENDDDDDYDGGAAQAAIQPRQSNAICHGMESSQGGASYASHSIIIICGQNINKQL